MPSNVARFMGKKQDKGIRVVWDALLDVIDKEGLLMEKHISRNLIIK